MSANSALIAFVSCALIVRTVGSGMSNYARQMALSELDPSPCPDINRFFPVVTIWRIEQVPAGGPATLISARSSRILPRQLGSRNFCANLLFAAENGLPLFYQRVTEPERYSLSDSVDYLKRPVYV